MEQSTLPPRTPDLTSFTRFVVCCDGTTNDGVNKRHPRTNVARLARCISSSTSGIRQDVDYMAGVGTGTSRINNLRDSMDGRGINNNIRKAYARLCQNWRPGDEIILVGFSRGAFTVRALAQLIDDIGLIKKESLEYLNDFFEAWKNQKRSSLPLEQMRREHLDHLRFEVAIKACAVWDTVPALTGDKLDFVGKGIPQCIEYAFHALALDEERAKFQPLLWKTSSSTKLRQCWFLGTHSDVGGGNKDTSLSNLSLAWMIAQLKSKGILEFDDTATRDLNQKPLPVEVKRHWELGNRERHVVVSQEAGKAGHYKLSIELPVEDFSACTRQRVSRFAMMQRAFGWKYRSPCDPDMNTHERLHWTARALLEKDLRLCKPLHRKIGERQLLVKMQEENEYRKEELDLLAAWIGGDCLRMIQICEERRSEGEQLGSDIRISRKDLNPLFAFLWRPDAWNIEQRPTSDAAVHVAVDGSIARLTRTSPLNPLEIKRDPGTVTRSGDVRMSTLKDPKTQRMVFGNGTKRTFPNNVFGLVGSTSSQMMPTLRGHIIVPFHHSLYASPSNIFNSPGQKPVPEVAFRKSVGLNGGGSHDVRGLSSLLKLQMLLRQRRELKHLSRRYEYFDNFGETTTGGLFATMLSRLGMSLEDCIGAYIEQL